MWGADLRPERLEGTEVFTTDKIHRDVWKTSQRRINDEGSTELDVPPVDSRDVCRDASCVQHTVERSTRLPVRDKQHTCGRRLWPTAFQLAPPPCSLLTVGAVMQHGSLLAHAFSSSLCKRAEMNREMTRRQWPRALTEECVCYYLLVSHFCASHKRFSLF